MNELPQSANQIQFFPQNKGDVQTEAFPYTIIYLNEYLSCISGGKEREIPV